MNDLQIHLNKKANVNNQINPFLTIMLHQIKKGLHQKNKKEDVSSRPHPLLFIYTASFAPHALKGQKLLAQGGH